MFAPHSHMWPNLPSMKFPQTHHLISICDFHALQLKALKGFPNESQQTSKIQDESKDRRYHKLKDYMPLLTIESGKH